MMLGRSGSRTLLVVLALTGGLTAALPRARAEAPPPPPADPATSPRAALTVFQTALYQELLRTGDAHYRAGRFKDAAPSYARAFQLQQTATLAFKLAESHRQLGQPRLANRYYEAYLGLAPHAPDEAQVMRQVAQLRAQLSFGETIDRDRSSAEAPATPAPPASGLLRRAGIAPLLIVAVGTGLMVGGAILQKQAVDQAIRSVNVGADPNGSRYQSAQRSYEASRGLLIGGAVGVVGGATWAIINLVRTRGETARPATLTFSGGPVAGGGQMVLGGQF
jgi:tetratricopeptide (TPR) repeat protein